MNQVDLLIIMIVIASALSGVYRGFIGAGGDVTAIVLGLGLASFTYPALAVLFTWVGLPKPMSDVFGFLATAIAVVLLVGWLSTMLSEKWMLPRRVSRTGGALMGGVMGVLLASVLILISGIITGSALPIEQSTFGRPITSLVPRLHESAERMGVPLPKLVQLPVDYRDEMTGTRQGLQFLRFNSSRLDGATCLHCRTAVHFEGYKFARGTLMSPKFVCPKCGRTSDGCQTFEGFHAIYDSCSVIHAQQGIQFDCGIWTNGWFTYPHGRCPVCSKEYIPEAHAITPQ